MGNQLDFERVFFGYFWLHIWIKLCDMVTYG
jgi:hypothetical protein